MDARLASTVRVVERAAADLLAPETTPGLAVALVVDGALAWRGGFGLADPSTGTPMDPDRRLRVASITKTFTSTMIVRLRDEGRLALHDPVVRHVPEFTAVADPFGGREGITLAQLLLHTSGLQRDVPAVPGREPGVHQDRLPETLAQARLVRRPDDRWHYSNLGYELLALVVSRVSGEPYGELLERTILTPAGLSETAFHPDPGRPPWPAQGTYPGTRPRSWEPAITADSDTMLGDGGLWSTVGDLARWIAFHCTSEEVAPAAPPPIIQPASLRELQRPRVLVDPVGWLTAQGLGFATFRVDDDLWHGHTGAIDGFRAIVLFRPAERLGVVALANGQDRPNHVAHVAAQALLAGHRAGQPPRSAATPPAVVATPGAGPAGRWRHRGLGAVVTVARDGTDLVRWDPDGSSLRLRPTDEPGTWEVAGDGESAGERMCWHPAADGRPEVLQDGSWSMVRVDP